MQLDWDLMKTFSFFSALGFRNQYLLFEHMEHPEKKAAAKLTQAVEITIGIFIECLPCKCGIVTLTCALLYM